MLNVKHFVDLVYEHGTTQAPPPSLAGALKGAVVGDDHHSDGDAAVTGLLGGQAEVKAVSGVVLHNEKDPRRSCRGPQPQPLLVNIVLTLYIVVSRLATLSYILYTLVLVVMILRLTNPKGTPLIDLILAILIM